MSEKKENKPLNEKSISDKRILRKALDFLRWEWRKLGQHYEKMCFQPFSPSWMQFSTV
jgi:RNA polymerase-interacting CarD/CdnL/TRCF family regulator